MASIGGSLLSILNRKRDIETNENHCYKLTKFASMPTKQLALNRGWVRVNFEFFEKLTRAYFFLSKLHSNSCYYLY